MPASKLVSPMHLYISKAVLLVILLSLLRPKYTMPVKVTLDMSLPVYNNFRQCEYTYQRMLFINFVISIIMSAEVSARD